MPPHNGIPEGWLEKSTIGKRVPGTRFIAFKVPLKQSLNNRVSSSDVFGPWELLATMEKEKEDLGLIIDLTNTKRYYGPEDLPDSVFYLKIFTVGREVPSDPIILSFKRAVRRFLRENPDNDKLIGVHCTHGLNRTGYLVCRYLIDVDGMDPKQAVELFNSSRGHTIERENYLSDLESGPKRSNQGMEESEAEPVRGRGGSERPPPLERRANSSYDRYHSGPPLHQRGMNHQQPWRPPPLFPPSLLPPRPHPLHPPPLHPPPHHPPPLLSFPPYGGWLPQPRYQWRAPGAAQWRRPSLCPESEPRGPRRDERGGGFYPEDDRRRSSQPEQEWRSSSHPEEERRRGHYSPGPPYPLLSRCSPDAFRTSEPNGHSASFTSDEPTGPRRNSRHRHTRRT